MRYTKVEGKWELIKDGHTIERFDDPIAFAYSSTPEGTLILLKHGPLGAVKDWVGQAINEIDADATRKVPEPGIDVVSGKFSSEFANKVITTTGCLENFLNNDKEEENPTQ